ncbi:MAG: hypothetical protein P1P65_01865 [Treponema sp.]
MTSSAFKLGASIIGEKKYKATGNVENKAHRPVNKKIIPEKRIEYVKAPPDTYLKEIAELFGCRPAAVLIPTNLKKHTLLL